jgi:hypothetical protein
VIGRVPVEPVDRLARDELLDVDDTRRFELHRFEVLLVEDDVLVLGDLVALHQIAARNLFAGAGVDGLHFDAVVSLRIDEVEADGLRLAGRRIEGNRTSDKRQAQMPLPRWTCGH